MPVAPEVGVAERDDDDVAGSLPDLLVAPRADVLLARLIGLHALDLGRATGERVLDERRLACRWARSAPSVCGHR